MHVRDASGRRVSLLNDDVATASQPPALYPIGGAYAVLSYYARGTRTSSTPTTPDLLRSNSYDSQTSAEPVSPLTPLHDLGRYVATAADARSRYDEYYAGRKRRSGAPSDGRSVSYEDDSAGATTSSERPAKRFPCRFRDSHGCEKTFTTSGHASRHSKIHTAEKAVPCSFAGCTKKFTRADNMKQHLETHYKDKSRPSSSRPSLSSSERRSSTSGKTSGRSKMTVPVANGSATANSTPLPSPGGAWDLRDLGPPLLGRPSIVHSPASGLDALALAVECQEGA